MLSQLTIQNFGLIDQVSLDFNNQLNILTGETGAGKSILIEALRIAIGDRIQSSQLRDPKEPCIIEAVFEITDAHLLESEILQDFLPEGESTLIIQRTYLPEGRNKIKINGFTVTVSQLKEIGNYLIDFHGPHDHQLLLSADSHIGMLDRLIEFKEDMKNYHQVYKQYSEVSKQLEELQSMSSSRERDLDLLSHQVKELEQVPLEQSRFEELLQEETKINNAQKLNECIQELLSLSEGEPNGISETIQKSFSPMKSLNQIDENTADFMDQLSNLQEINDQLGKELRDYADSLSFDPQEAQEISNQIDIYHDIQRKYGPTLDVAKNFYEEAKSKHSLLTDWEHNDSELRTRLKELEEKLAVSALKITKARKKASLSLKKTVEKELKELGIVNVEFEARIEKDGYHWNGLDSVIFYISPNAGEELKPLAQIVSSGEAARVMLALKRALIKVDPIPVLIFDEIDAQIGGRLGSITGQKLRDISRIRQVILITHLPQIASFADVHFKVSKKVKSGRAVTIVDLLDKESRVKEIAAMMSGEQETTISITHAEDMLANASKA